MQIFYSGSFLPGGREKQHTRSNGWARLYVNGKQIGELWVQGRKAGIYTVYNGKTILVTAACA